MLCHDPAAPCFTVYVLSCGAEHERRATGVGGREEEKKVEGGGGKKKSSYKCLV